MVAAIATGISIVVALLAPYSAYGRIAGSFLRPVWLWGNNILADIAEHYDSYAFYSVDVWVKGGATFIIAAVTLVALAILSWRNGRTYCNTICPVGTLLGCLSRYSVFAPVIDTSKCNGCGLCARNCKAACINSKKHEIDYSRCVACFDCLEKCSQKAISYKARYGKKSSEKDEPQVSAGRRTFVVTALATAATAAVKAQEKKVDGGLAVIEDKQVRAQDKDCSSGSFEHTQP